MQYKIRHKKKALKDLRNIAETLNKYYPSTFYKFLKNFNSKIEILRRFPYSYQLINNSKSRRVQLKYKYQIIYSIKQNQVIISRIQFPK